MGIILSLVTENNIMEAAMSHDWNYYYDFDKEQKITQWTQVSRDGNIFVYEAQFECQKEDDYVLLVPCPRLLNDVNDDSDAPVFVRIEMDGKKYSFRIDAEGAYVGIKCARQGFRTHLAAGNHAVRIQCSYSGSKDVATWLNVTLIKDLPAAPAVTGYDTEFRAAPFIMPVIEKEEMPDLTDYIPGAGCTDAPGRFGFSKGDGVLDCAMPSLGFIDKMYLCGHPQYNKPFRWSYSTLPENALLRGSYQPAVEKIDGDTFRVNHMGVTWTSQFNGKKFSCTYSLGTAGIMTESEEDYMRLSSLEYAGNYQYVVVPGKNACRILSLDQLEKGIEMAENFLVFFGSTEFPDLPLMVTLDKSPNKIEVCRDTRTERLKEIRFHGIHRMISATPYGMESPDSISPDDTEMLNDLLLRCRTWSHAFMAYPVKCEEYFKVDEQAERVHIIQKFSYRYLTDEWNTAPLELAPLPPVTSICGTTITEADTDFHFATKFGWLKGGYGKISSYSIPFMITKRKFPLRDAAHDEPEQLLKQSMKEYFRFVDQFPETIQAYPYAGSLMEPFAMPSSMFYFMQEDDREKLRKYAAERLKGACDSNRQYLYPVIQFSYMMSTMPEDDKVIEIYKDPQREHKKLWNWYERTEPFTGTKFNICYLNLYFLSENIIKTGAKEEIAGMKIPLIENDWGVGLTFYYMNLCALASGDFTPIRENWELIKSVFLFFDKMHDWACMGTGYSDNAILWAEGANYGAFTGYVNMAEAVGDEYEKNRAIYFAAKQMALRMAIIRISIHYFNKIYNVPSWYITRFLHEEATPFYQFQNAANFFVKNRYRPGGIYNFTTEGLYPEIFEALRKYCPEDFVNIIGQLHDIFRTETETPSFRNRGWCTVEQVNCMLMNNALDATFPAEKVIDDIDYAEEHNLLMKKWRGIHIFSRRLPEYYFKAQVLAWNNMKQHPVWMEHWENIIIEDAILRDSVAEIRYRLQPEQTGKLCFGCRKKPARVTVNDVPVAFTMIHDAAFQIDLNTDGIVKLYFETIKRE